MLIYYNLFLISRTSQKWCWRICFHALGIRYNGNQYLVFQKCFSTALRKRLSCSDSRASISRYTCHMSTIFSFSERTSITLSPIARVWILDKFPPIFLDAKFFPRFSGWSKMTPNMHQNLKKENTFLFFG